MSGPLFLNSHDAGKNQCHHIAWVDVELGGQENRVDFYACGREEEQLRC